jgi:transcriptional regulator with XRE-family HTH domain
VPPSLTGSQNDLAKLANVPPSTVRDFEKGRRVPIANNLEAMHRALEASDVSFEMDSDEKATGIAIRCAPVE